MTWARNLLNLIQFRLRNDFYGKVPLRKTSPVPMETAIIRKERHFYQLVLRKALRMEVSPKTELVIDVGCRNWSYAKTLADFFPKARLIGVEVDGGRRYWNLYRRMDLARSYARELGRAEFFHGDFRDIDVPLMDNRDILHTFFFPFVSSNPCLTWGLPLRFSQFSGLVDSVIRVMQKRKANQIDIVSSHQGEWEAEIARNIYRDLGFCWQENRIDPPEFRGLWPSMYPVFVFHCSSPGSSILWV